MRKGGHTRLAGALAGTLAAIAISVAVSACDTREDEEGLPSPAETSLPGVTYSGGPAASGEPSPD